jgi:hypothetical protein
MNILAFSTHHASPSATAAALGYLRLCRTLAHDALKRGDFAEALEQCLDAFRYRPAPGVDRHAYERERVRLFGPILGEARAALTARVIDSYEGAR